MEPMRSLHVADEGDTHSELDDIPYSELQSGCARPPMVGNFAGNAGEFVDAFGRRGSGRRRLVNRGHKLSDHARSFAGRLKDRI